MIKYNLVICCYDKVLVNVAAYVILAKCVCVCVCVCVHVCVCVCVHVCVWCGVNRKRFCLLRTTHTHLTRITFSATFTKNLS